MYFIIRGKRTGSLAGLSPSERKAAIDAHDKAESLSLRESAAERRKHFVPIRLGQLAAEKGIERGERQAREHMVQAKVIKESMKRRING